MPPDPGATPPSSTATALDSTPEAGAARASRPWRTWESYFLVFAASLCTLVLEIVAGRVLAPAIGVSLYTWTSVIGVVLAGVAIGNYLGGQAARRAATAVTLAGLLLLSALSVWIVSVLVRVVDLPRLLVDLSPLPRLVLLVGGCFFLPSALLGGVTPLVAQLTLRERAEAGAVVGRLGAVSAAGSIAGTFGAGFWLIPTFGTRAILLGVAVALAALAGLTVWGRVRPARLGTGMLAALVLGGALVAAGTAYAQAQDRRLCVRETAYYCIRVTDSSVGQLPYRILRHDRTTQGYTSAAYPRLIVADYAQVFAELAAYQQGVSPVTQAGAGGQGGVRALFIGGGSYTIPRYLEDVYPGSRLDVMEVDPGVTLTAEEYLGLRPGGAIQVHHVDARLGIGTLGEGEYHLVYGDAFSDISVPWHLTTVEFNREVRRVLRPDGFYTINVIDTWATGRFLPAFVRTLKEVFPQVSVLRVRDWEQDRLSNWVLVASPGVALDAARLETLTRPGVQGREPARGRVISPAEVDRWLAERSRVAPLLTDDYAPVDRLLADRYLDE